MSAEFLSRSISSGEVVFGEHTEARPAVFICRLSTRSERRRDQIGYTEWPYVRQRDVSHYGKMTLCPRFRRGEDGRAARPFRVQGQKGILKYEQELRQKGPLYTPSIPRRCTIAVALCIVLPFHSY